MKTFSALGTLLAVSLMLAPTASAQNLLLNPGFETSDGGVFAADWITFGESPVISDASTDNIFLSGSRAAKIFNFDAGCPLIPPAAPKVNGFVQGVTGIEAGKVYTFSGSAYVESAEPLTGDILCESNRALARIAVFDAEVGGNEIAGHEVAIGDSDTPLDQWNEFSISVPATANARRIEAVIVYIFTDCAGGAVYMDDFAMTTSDPVTTSPNLVTNADFSQSLATGWTTFGNAGIEPNGTYHYSAGGAAFVFGPFSANPDDTSGFFQDVAVTAGATYELSAYVMSSCNVAPITGQNANRLEGIISFLDGSGVEIEGFGATFLDNTNSLGEYTLQKVQGLAPVGAVTARVQMNFVQPNGGAAGEGGSVFVDDVFFGEATATNAPASARGVALAQNNPNPFNPKTSITFALDRGADVNLQIFDAKGRLVRTLAARGFDAGSHTLEWNGRSDDGESVASGIYHYVLEAGGARQARSMVLLK